MGASLLPGIEFQKFHKFRHNFFGGSYDFKTPGKIFFWI